MNITVPAFISYYLGNPAMGTTPENHGQCVGLVARWWQLNKLPAVWGNAKDLPVNAPPSHYLFHPNGPDNFPPPGAVLVWGATWGNGYGHTALVVAANSMHVAVFEQNNPTGSPPIVATHGYSGVIGWLTF